MIPPALVRIRSRTTEKRFGLWLPVILLWPLLLVAVAIALVVVLLRALFTFRFRRLLRETGIILLALRFLGLLRQLRIEVEERDHEFRLAFY